MAKTLASDWDQLRTLFSTRYAPWYKPEIGGFNEPVILVVGTEGWRMYYCLVQWIAFIHDHSSKHCHIGKMIHGHTS